MNCPVCKQVIETSMSYCVYCNHKLPPNLKLDPQEFSDQTIHAIAFSLIPIFLSINVLSYMRFPDQFIHHSGRNNPLFRSIPSTPDLS